MKYRIVPGAYLNYELERKGWLFWHYVTMDNSYTHLVQVVKDCGGTLVNKGNANGR